MTFWKRKTINLGDQKVTELTVLEWKRFFSIKLFNFHPTDGKRVYKKHGFPPNTMWMEKPFIGHKQSELSMMYSALRRMVIRGHFNEIYEGIPNAN